jgi:hypothetical protein
VLLVWGADLFTSWLPLRPLVCDPDPGQGLARVSGRVQALSAGTAAQVCLKCQISSIMTQKVALGWLVFILGCRSPIAFLIVFTIYIYK